MEDKIREVCEILDGDIIEDTKLECDADEIRLVYHKRDGWLKYYWEGKLHIWGNPERISIKRNDPFFGDIININFKDPEEVGVAVSCKKYYCTVSPAFREDEKYISDKYIEKYMKMRKRAIFASRKRAGVI